MSDTRRQLLHILKRRGPSTARTLADELGVTVVAVRQHLAGLESEGLLRSEPIHAEGRGRPAHRWTLTKAAHRQFPDRHGELATSLIGLLVAGSGQASVDRLLADRVDRQVSDYRDRMPDPDTNLAGRVQALAAIRTEEGYMAEARPTEDGWLLIEHHCPICDAAHACQGLCSAELDVFREVLGPGVQVERIEHIIAGQPRCVYAITPGSPPETSTDSTWKGQHSP